MSTYGIFKNKDEQTLVFYPCPKNANSSAKFFFIKHLGLEKKYIFLGDDIPRFKQTNDHFGLKKILLIFCQPNNLLKRLIQILNVALLESQPKDFYHHIKIE